MSTWEDVQKFQDEQAKLRSINADLLAALKEAKEMVCSEYCTVRQHNPRCVHFQAVIAKAEGKG